VSTDGDSSTAGMDDEWNQVGRLSTEEPAEVLFAAS